LTLKSSNTFSLFTNTGQKVGPLTQNAFADKANGNGGTVSKLLLEDRSVRDGL